MERQEQRSREFGIKLAQALRQRAVEAAKEHDLDARYVALGAAEYLRERRSSSSTRRSTPPAPTPASGRTEAG